MILPIGYVGEMYSFKLPIIPAAAQAQYVARHLPIGMQVTKEGILEGIPTHEWESRLEVGVYFDMDGVPATELLVGFLCIWKKK